MTTDTSPWYIKSLSLSVWCLGITFVVLVILSLFACSWRFLNLYEMSVKAQTVQARIAMEQHQEWMREITERRSQLKSTDELKSSVDQQTHSMPNDLTKSTPEPSAHTIPTQAKAVGP